MLLSGCRLDFLPQVPHYSWLAVNPGEKTLTIGGVYPNYKMKEGCVRVRLAKSCCTLTNCR